MNTDFRILAEETFTFKGGKLYVMLLREDAKFGVEVVNREKTFGRLFSDDRQSAEFLFDSVKNRLLLYKKIGDAEDAIVLCFGLKSMSKILFSLTMGDRVTNNADMKEIRYKFDHDIRLKFGYKKKLKELNGLTIYIYESRTSRKPFGLLYGTDRGDDMLFELL
jgi:hypothetical protein